MLGLNPNSRVTAGYIRTDHPDWAWTSHFNGPGSWYYVGVRGMTAVRVEKRAGMFDGDGESMGGWWVQPLCYRSGEPLGSAQLFSSWNGRPPEMYLKRPDEGGVRAFRCYSCGYMRPFECGGDDDPMCDHCWGARERATEIPGGVTYGEALKSGWVVCDGS
jgi:hypothetical protein